jgi:hypothetical protein
MPYKKVGLEDSAHPTLAAAGMDGTIAEILKLEYMEVTPSACSYSHSPFLPR